MAISSLRSFFKRQFIAVGAVFIVGSMYVLVGAAPAWAQTVETTATSSTVSDPSDSSAPVVEGIPPFPTATDSASTAPAASSTFDASSTTTQTAIGEDVGSSGQPLESGSVGVAPADHPSGGSSNFIMAGLDSVSPYIGLGDADPRDIVARLIKVGLGLLGIIFLMLILYSGFLWMTSGGDEEAAKKARAAFTQAIIGVIIILSANSIMRFVLNTFVSAGSIPVDAIANNSIIGVPSVEASNPTPHF